MNKLIPWDSAPLLPGPLGDIARRAREEREKKDKRGCAYPDCANYKKGATRYCCAGCNMDHADTRDSERTDEIEETRMNNKGNAVTRILSKMQEVEDPIVIHDRFVKTAETWFLRHVEQGWGEARCMNQSWLVLLNGAYQSTDADSHPRYAMDVQDKGDYRIVDTNYIPVHYSDTKYLTIAHVHKKDQAELIVKALNAYQPKPQRRSKNG
jgi:hypothetical protein